MECTSKKIVSIHLTQDEAEDLKQEMLFLLSDYDKVSNLTVLNTLNNLLNVEISRISCN